MKGLGQPEAIDIRSDKRTPTPSSIPKTFNLYKSQDQLYSRGRVGTWRLTQKVTVTQCIKTKQRCKRQKGRISQSIKSNLYSAICRKRIRGACWRSYRRSVHVHCKQCWAQCRRTIKVGRQRPTFVGQLLSADKNRPISWHTPDRNSADNRKVY